MDNTSKSCRVPGGVRLLGESGPLSAFASRVRPQDQVWTLISFTPGFSQVSRKPELGGNRLNGFQTKHRRLITWLKPGVNKTRKVLLGQSLSQGNHRRIERSKLRLERLLLAIGLTGILLSPFNAPAQANRPATHSRSIKAVLPPAPFGPVPSPRQLRWHELEFYGFVHFNINTFTDKEWGYGDEDPALFNPTDFDAEQIVRTAQQAGMKALILTAKHHDGFCLWPSQYTEHSVKHSPWRNGHGDVVKEISDACRKYGLKFGIYLSPWDRNRNDYGATSYLTYFRNQLRELLTGYGPVCEIFFDGANGGDGFYGGARETRRIDRETFYDWPGTWKLVRELQPDACLFSDAGPDVRWVGNERGVAGETCWATLNREEFVPGRADQARLNRGDRPGSSWVPAECDVSIRPGWFYHAQEDGKVRTAKDLLDLYYSSVGRGASLLLNLAPDRRGQIHEADVQALREFRRLLDETFGRNLAARATVSASNVRGGRSDPRFRPQNVIDNRRDTYWASADEVQTPELVLELQQPTTFNVVRLREYLPLGQRVEGFALDAWRDSRWIEIAKGSSIGNCRLVRVPPVNTSKLRLRITQAPVCPAISEVGVFLQPK